MKGLHRAIMADITPVRLNDLPRQRRTIGISASREQPGRAQQQCESLQVVSPRGTCPASSLLAAVLYARRAVGVNLLYEYDGDTARLARSFLKSDPCLER